MPITAKQRRLVHGRAADCCEYCKSQLRYSTDSFSVEHIVPRRRGGTDALSNLALACQGCNNRKYVGVEAVDPLTGQTVPLYHPRRQTWDAHFAWSADFLVICGLTPTGRATVEKLDLNREPVVNLRRLLRAAAEHPPAS